MEEYDDITAHHYAAYRPPLHSVILKQLLGTNRYDGAGLDVGCGTGHSAVALSGFCSSVLALEPSAFMLNVAPEHPSVSYRRQTMAEWANEAPAQRFELLSFAGSLFYQDVKEAVNSFPKLLKKEASILVYDFNLELSQVLGLLGYEPPVGVYDHQRGLDDHLNNSLTLKTNWSDKLTFSASGTEVAHLVCSVKEWREALMPESSFSALSDKLRRLLPNDSCELSARCYGRRYEFRGAL
ncbi:class I SAM-dependent methyltransferase [Neolewinella aurantiaca]|uniref:Class I SAM-dependent methyltransferase n=1 Tax=Neolewinella aurantiaca TaxID=2602767 RepID=A0A5C7FML6_9BACT|nr:class I SAM-dependent methyltransferase [Neolewinella aurantiaca]TXF88719.1 class I SAM-dependent methyltransferase [Neolewinella aurantiaca]